MRKSRTYRTYRWLVVGGLWVVLWTFSSLAWGQTTTSDGIAKSPKRQAAKPSKARPTSTASATSAKPPTARLKVSLALATTPSGAKFSLIDPAGKVSLSGKTPFVGTLAQGSYKLILEHEGFFPETRSLTLKGGAQRVLQIALTARVGGTTKSPPARREVPETRKEPPSKPVRRSVGEMQPPRPGLDATPRQTPPQRKPRKRKTGPSVAKTVLPGWFGRVPWLPLVLGTGCLVTGGVFLVVSQVTLANSSDRQRFQVDAFRMFTDGQTQQTTGVFLLLAGGAALVIGGFLYWRGPSKRTPNRRVSGYNSPLSQVQLHRLPSVSLGSDTSLFSPPARAR